MINWYDIPGIEYIWTMPRDADNHILFEGVEDDLTGSDFQGRGIVCTAFQE